MAYSPLNKLRETLCSCLHMAERPYVTRGGPLLRMDTANEVSLKEWGCSSLLPLAVWGSETDAFCTRSRDDEMAETVGRRAIDSVVYVETVPRQ